jgi:aminoglycoside phosphotransferase family enzyme/predicted kinase
MITEDQTAIVEFLGSASTHGGEPVERIDTHTAVVFLAGRRVWKLKRAVRFDYLDASTADRRKELCEAEVRLSRRTAPTIYRGVAAITRGPDGTLAIGGAGVAIDWVVEMNRFDQHFLLDRLAGSGRLDLDLMAALGETIARFHLAAEPRLDYGGAAGILRVIDGNVRGFEEYGRGVLDDLSCARMTTEARAHLARCAALLDLRRTAGLVRQCHGDLHLRNIVLVDGNPTLFDAIEFNDDIACIDVLYDLAFLLMDLWRRGLPRHANAVWNAYLRTTGDFGGLAAMPVFLSCRAAIRAKTSATAAHFQHDASRAGELHALAREYVAMAARLLRPPRASVIAVGGLSGTGKSTLALTLAPFVGAVPGAVVLRSDEIRKQLCGVRMSDHLGAEGYTAEVSDRVYATMASRASDIVRGGHSAVVDGVYARRRERDAIERVAADAGVPFAGFWLEAPEATLVARVQARRHDASDADASVIGLQREQDTGHIQWTRIDASQQFEAVRHEVERLLDAQVTGAARN